MKTKNIAEGPFDVSKIPLFNISRVSAAKVIYVVKKICDDTVDTVGEKFSYVFQYDAVVSMKSGDVRRKRLIR